MAVRSYTVSQINGYIKNLIASDYLLSDIYIKGEVSNCKYHSSGHIYFTLKDGTGAIAAVMFRGNADSGLSFKLQDGQMVIAHGNVNVYERDGKYQFYVRDIEHDGIGSLYEEYERLKQKLYEQGLFEFDIKKPIPVYPKKVGIVTAETGAAIQDIKNIAKRRNPFVQLILYPARVQGEGAAEDIAHGIKVLDEMSLDTIIIGRGGGSIEDLWAFNEEVVAWAIYNAKTPIISGTGHEIDNTIADYAADLRAPTPSAACELAIPDVMTVIRHIEGLEEHMARLMDSHIDNIRSMLAAYERQLRLLNPKQKLMDRQQYIDELYDRLSRLMKQQYDRKCTSLQLVSSRINGMS
ncbi:MAG: exodeoxyribonuclease VII large subunit, partial [Coprococcus sp.]